MLARVPTIAFVGLIFFCVLSTVLYHSILKCEEHFSVHVWNQSNASDQLSNTCLPICKYLIHYDLSDARFKPSFNVMWR